jgi:putative transposase
MPPRTRQPPSQTWSTFLDNHLGSLAPRSPWQNPYAERLVGSVRRECLDHMIVLGEQHLRRILTAYFSYYHKSRTHLSLHKDAPETRAVHPPSMGAIVEIPDLGGLHHHYERRAA